MKIATIILMITTAIWLSLAMIGLSLVSNVASQGVSGYPNSSQIIYYIVVPCTMFVSSILSIVFNYKLENKLLFIFPSLLLIISIPIYLIYFVGGV